ncbi:polysaccharide deacetylase family protein [Romboutsia sp.]|uniref:polysaccharide deacetylase family protein n=1 Tax=Romboutsia sp. TaxID=1965302 RepID=UPI003F30BE38
MGKKIDKKKATIILSGGAILIMSIANINISYGNFKNNYSFNMQTLSTNTITDMICNTIEEGNKGPSKSSGKVAYITIDDGPSKYTEDILNILEKYNAKGTFFMIDKNMKVYPEKVKSVIEKGNSVGLHSVSHDINKLYKNKNSAKEEFERNKETFYKITGQETKLIRLPYGSKPYTSRESYNVLIDEGYSIWDWDIDTQDWRATSEQIIQNVKLYSKNQNEIIILMHEKKQTVQALDKLLSYLCDEGYELLAIEQNKHPQNFWLGNLYND